MLLVVLTTVFYLKTSNLFSNDKERYVYFSDDQGTTGLTQLSSFKEPSITISAKKGINDTGVLEIYQASLTDLLTFLAYDNDFNQINKTIDASKMSHLLDLNINLSEKGQKYTLPLPETGIFLLQVKKGDIIDQTFIVRSSFGSIATESKDKIIVWNQDFKTLKSLTGEAKITSYNLKNGAKAIENLTADTDSVATLSLTQDVDLIIVESQSSFSLIPLNIQQAYGNYYDEFKANTPTNTFYTFTDRPIYLPGDTVNFKSILRQNDDFRYSFSKDTTLYAIVSKDWSGKQVIYQQILNVDPQHSFVGGTFTLPKNLNSGEYFLFIKTAQDIKDDNYSSLYVFSVENYRKPEYQLSSAVAKNEIIRGDKFVVDVKGEYYSGQPLSSVDLKYKVMHQKAYDPEFYSNDYQDRSTACGGKLLEEGSLTLDKTGKGKLKIDSGRFDFEGEDQILCVDFVYQDPTGNPASTALNLFARAADISIYRQGDRVVTINETVTLPFSIKANRDKALLAQKVNLEISRTWWEKSYTNGGKYSTYDSKTEVISNHKLQSDASGAFNFSFTPSQKGEYEITATLNDRLGNPLVKTFHLWVSDQEGVNWDRPNDSSLRMSLDKDLYQPQDNLKINLSSDFPSRDVFLTFNRKYSNRYRVVRIDQKQQIFDEKLLPTDLPNIYLEAKSFNQEKFESVSSNISINSDSKKITYQITTDKSEYAPGDQVVVDILATDINGQPLTSNFALWAVDKAISALSENSFFSIFNAFWRETYNNTSDANSLSGISLFSSAERGGCFLPDTQILMSDSTFKAIKDVKVGDFVLTKVTEKSNKLVKAKVTSLHKDKSSSYLIINGSLKVTSNHILFINDNWSMAALARIGDTLLDKNGQKIKVTSIEYLNLESDVYNLSIDRYHTFFANNFYVHNQKGDPPRDNLVDTAYWNLSVNTDQDGKAQLTFKLPDNLTTWTLYAIGADHETKVGFSSSEIKVAKDLALRPVLPNILSAGDQIKIAALVNNFTDQDLITTVSLKSNAGEIKSSLDQKVKISANSFSQVSWDMLVGSGGRSADFEFKVVDQNGNSDAIVQHIDIRSLGYWQQKSEFKKNSSLFSFADFTSVDPNKSEINLTLGSNLLGSLPSAMNYLINYNYGCVEQTTSALMSKLIAQKYSSIFSESLKNQKNSLSVESLIEKLTLRQNYNGSWSWWEDSYPNTFVSAYVFSALIQSRELGYQIDQYVIDEAHNYFINIIKNSTDTSERIMAAYALSFNGQKERITTNLDQLDSDLLAIAVLTNLKADFTDSSQNGLDLLLSKMQKSDIGNFWPASSPDRFASIEGSTALAIQALIKSGNYDPQVQDALNYLINSRHSDYWGNTFSTVQSVLAITDFHQKQKLSDARVDYQIIYQDKLFAQDYFDLVKNKTRSFDLPVLETKDQTLQIIKEGEAPLYANLTQKLWIKGNQGAKYSDKVEVTKHILNFHKPVYSLIPGDLAQIIITINFPKDSQDVTSGYAVIEDHLPSGLIPVNYRLLNEDGYEQRLAKNSYQTQYLADGVIMPIYLSGDQTSYTYSYHARVISEGEFNNPPLFFTMMYRPDIWGRSAFSTLTIKHNREKVLYPINFSVMAITTVMVVAFILIVIVTTFISLIIRVLKKKKHNNN